MNPLYVLAVLCLCVALAEWLTRRTRLRHVGTAVLSIVLAAVAANAGLIPSASDHAPIYGGIFTYVAPFSIFVLLLEVELRSLRRAGLPLLGLFVLGAFATVAGVLAAWWIMDAPSIFGERQAALAGMFVATYTGGALNFNAVALHYRVVDDGLLYTATLAVDNIMSSLWVAATLLLPKFLQRSFPRSGLSLPAQGDATASEAPETLHVSGLATLMVLGVAALWASERLSAELAGAGVIVPSILLVTTIALMLAQTPLARRCHGRRTIGLYSVYLFLATIGAHADIAAVVDVGRLGLMLFAVVAVAIGVHASILFIVGGLMRQDWRVVAIASQANIGGSTTAFALAESFARPDLLLPAVLVGTLGNALGTYLGFAVAAVLG